MVNRNQPIDARALGMAVHADATSPRKAPSEVRHR
jgi:hypothetical protein